MPEVNVSVSSTWDIYLCLAFIAFAFYYTLCYTIQKVYDTLKSFKP